MKRYRYILSFMASIILLYTIQTLSLSIDNMSTFVISLVFALIMDLLMLYIGNMNIEFTETITIFIYILFGTSFAVFFEFVYTLIGMIANNNLKKRRDDILKSVFNISMSVIITYISATSVTFIRKNALYNQSDIMVLLIVAFIFEFIYLSLNVTLISIDIFLEEKSIVFKDESERALMAANLLLSTLLSVVLYISYSYVGHLGIVLVLSVSIIIHYAFYLYGKIEFENVLFKSLLNATEDLIKYGDLKDKSDHLLLNLKEIIPYTVAALYFFDINNDEVVFPISYYAPEDIDIGELDLNVKSGRTFKNVKDGKIYISKDIKSDKNVNILGKLTKYTDAAILIPITIEEQVRGLIYLGGNKGLFDFLSKNVNDALSILSRHIALALLNYDYMSHIKRQADTDALTGLNNRRVFNREIENLIKTNTSFSIVIYDIDNFKKVNDIYGHLVGDEVLKVVAGVIKNSIRKTDIACRFGGEEIVIIFKNLSKEDALVIAERIRKKIEHVEIFTLSKRIHVTVSGGVAHYPNDGKTIDEILNKADEVLYNECKNKGKNRVACV